jgi:DHA1 family multidrug resistance protein-like MFS transporter
MDTVDRDIEKAERDASSPHHQTPQFQSVTRTSTAGSSSSSSSSSSSASNVSGRMSRIPTQGDTLERNATALSRIQTARSQHVATVGRKLGVKSREDGTPLPVMGAGKEYPPLLPEREEYVVEFDGEHDERHAQNWPMKKK